MLIEILTLALVVQDPPPPSDPVVRLDPEVQSWLDRSPALPGGDRGPIWDDGRVHGEVSVAIGTGGYRAYGGEITTPVGAGGRLSLRYHQSEGDVWRDRGRYDRPHWGEALGADDRPIHGPHRRFPDL